jgi:succinoglycan biosynthesis transport protein ExoP
MDPEQTTLSIEQVLGVFRRRGPWILLCVVLAAAAAYGYSKHKTKKYTATAALAFSNNSLSQQIAGLSNGSSVASQAQQVASNLELVKVGDTSVKTANLLGHGLTAEKVSTSLTVGAQGETNVIVVSATSVSPVFAAVIANTYVNQFVKGQQVANRRLFRSALALVNKQLASMPPALRFGTDGLDLQERAHTLGLLAALNGGTVKVAQEASVPTSPSSPKTKTNTVLAGVLGLLLGIALAFLHERFDRRIRKPEELESAYGLPMLGVVPKSSALAQSASRDGGNGAALPPAEAEAFSLIRAHLRFFNVDRDLRTVLIASPAPDDGKTTIARHLAEAAARLGSRVLLLEVDLRRPALAGQLGIEPGSGLAGVLIGDVTVDQATRQVALQAPPGEGASGRTLDVLAAGAVLPPNPGELIESQAMDRVLQWARSAYDLVVIDTPPLAAVSDAFPLLAKVDGVVIVGRIGQSRRDAAEQLNQVLASSGAPLLGVIANGAKSGGPVPYPGGGGSSAGVASANGTSSSEEPAPTAAA